MNGFRLTILFLGALLCMCMPDPDTIKKNCVYVDRVPAITPDYSGIMAPPNIAPLNFVINEPGEEYCAEISSNWGDAIAVTGYTPSLCIPIGKWKKLLNQNIGQPLRISIYVKDKFGAWRGYKPLYDTIAREPIDGYVTYRTLSYLYNFSTDLHIYERDLGSFIEKQLINSNNFAWGCCNCHTPKGGDPSTFVTQFRSKNFGSGMLLSINGKLRTIGSRLGYPAWHPGGKIIAFAVYNVRQCFHESAKNFIDVYDNTSDIVLYDVDHDKTFAIPELFGKQTLKTWPTWSPDGRYLYYCFSPTPWTDIEKTPPDNFDMLKFSLLRIAYNTTDKTWGPVDTVLNSTETGLSISQPRFSPDGRFLLFCMHYYGGYPHTQISSDLYMMDMATGKYGKPDINSDFSESWHDWSKNGRWILFSSKRNGGIFTRIYFSYVDSSGIAHKPFIMPQSDPAFYESFIKCYNYPEFATGPIPFSERRLLEAIQSKNKINVALPASLSVPIRQPNPYFQ